MQLTDTSHLKHRNIHQLSDGQLQRTLIAKALAQDTDIIILDEPTAHLDIHHTYQVFSILKDLVANTQKTVIVSTHQVNLAIQLADDFILLSDDDTLQGNLDELLEQDAFETLFPKNLIHFNKTSHQFTINK